MNKLYERLFEKNNILKKDNCYNFLPDIKSYNNIVFSNSVKGIEEFYQIKSSPDYSVYNGKKYYSWTSGDPIKYKIYRPAQKKIIEYLKHNTDIYKYPETSGTYSDKNILKDYCKNIGIDNLSINNIAITASTTHAFSMIFRLISKPGDALIVPCPNYGLLDLIPERIGLNVIPIFLKQENNYFIDLKEFEELIINTNKKLKKENKVIGILNLNPNNPLGIVLGNKQKNELYGIGKICKKYGMYVIDDMVYRDLCYNQDNIALPIASYNSLFENTITVFSLSKAYEMAGIRGGFVVANNKVIKGINDMIFQTVDSISTLTTNAVTATYNIKYNNYRKKYINNLLKIYKYRYDLLKAIIYGLNNVETNTKKILNDCKKVLGKKNSLILLEGFKYIKLYNDMEIESGFFALLDFSWYKGKRINGTLINTDIDMFKYLFKNLQIKSIPGSAFMMPEEKIIIRINFAIDINVLLQSLFIVKEKIDMS